MDLSFKVLYTKDCMKKRKAYQDGTFLVKKTYGDSCVFILRDEYEKELKRVTEKATKYAVRSGIEFVFGAFEVQVEECIDGLHEDCKLATSSVPAITMNPQISLKRPFLPVSQTSTSVSGRLLHANHTSVYKKNTVVHEASLDASLMKVMRPHQIEGANFLLKRLTLPIDDANSFDEDNGCRGAILADEMGLGKTLTAISVLWAFVRQGGCKGLVVCPSSLIDNWEREMRQWLGVKMRPLVLRPGMNAETTINSFVIGHVSLTPALLLSYEMFRKHAVLLNTVPTLDVLICDEGHRLKNVGGTKTIQALSQCKARRRIVLSGTPVQNDLDELFAVVSFVQPLFLGPLPEFKQKYTGPIIRASEPNASERHRQEGDEAARQLRDLMTQLMLRRTQADILSKTLPPRTDYVVYCRLTQWQQNEYMQTVARINSSIGYGQSHLAQSDDDEAEEDSGGGLVNTSVVLPGLQQLRKTCIFSENNVDNSTAFAKARQVSDENTPPQETSSFSQINAKPSTFCNVNGSGGSGRLTSLLNSSSKLQFLVALIAALQSHAQSTTSPMEKVVVVSNFTSTLDLVQSLAGARGWGDVLRIDGQVPVDRRQGLVDAFNRVSDKRFLFLLSSKAGGVGINLIGGSRLVMLDPDWNPATDKQAMSRIWREGQKKPVFVYRLIAKGHIEDAILNRQYAKSDLASVLTSLDDTEGSNDSSGAIGGAISNKKKMSLTVRDLQQLMLPSVKKTDFGDDETAESAEEGTYDEEQEALAGDEILRLAVDRVNAAAIGKGVSEGGGPGGDRGSATVGVVAKVEKRSAEFY